MEINLTDIIITIVGLTFSAVIIPLVRAAFTWLKGKTNNEAIKSALTEAQIVADNVVAGLQANVVDGLKAKSTDGKLTTDEAKEVADMAIDAFLSDLSSKSLTTIEENADDIVAYISRLIEERLLWIKK